MRGIDEQVAKAAKAVAGLAPVKRNRFIALDGAVKSVNRELEARAWDLAGLKGYRTNPAACPDGPPVTADFVIGSYHELWNIEKSFRMSKSDLRARPIYHRKRDSIEAHLTIVFAALAVTRFIEDRTGWSKGSSSALPAATAPSRSAPATHPHRRRPAPARPPRNPRPHQVTQPPAGSQIHVQATVPATSVSTNPATMIATRA